PHPDWSTNSRCLLWDVDGWEFIWTGVPGPKNLGSRSLGEDLTGSEGPTSTLKNFLLLNICRSSSVGDRTGYLAVKFWKSSRQTCPVWRLKVQKYRLVSSSCGSALRD
ncbi:hypothetical protein XENOCAPTIV_022418, partial [Xenoophorus captivus]